MSNPFEVIEARLSSIENLILDLKHKTQTVESTEQSDELLTREEACKFLQINSTTLWHWTNKGKVTAYGIGNRRYYKKAELIDALKPLKK